MSVRRPYFLLVLLAGFSGRAQAATLPANFYDTLVNSNGNMTNPTAMALAPDGRIFVCQQGGALRVIKNGSLLPTAFFTIPAATISSAGERGLLGVAFDPNFTANRYIYIYSTHIEPTGSVTFAGATTVSGPVTYNRVTRLTADTVNPDTALAGSETLILNMYPLTAATNHNGGAMHFGLDGKLYIAAGENATNTNSQTLANLLGKISRINPDGSIPIDNPFYGTAVGNNRAIWVMGLRNPFTFNIQSGTGRIFINDVGNLTWEEINDGTAGANYGWPTTEGAFVEASFPNFKHPAYFYQSNGGPCAITGGAFLDAGTSMFPAAYTGKYYFADYCGGWIRYITTPSAGVTLPEASFTGFATGYTSPVGLEVGPDGALYVLTGANSANGQVHRIHYSLTAAPVILNDPSSVTVTVGQNASFTVSASGQTPVTYLWQRNGVDIASSNSPIYTLNNAQLSDSGAIFRAIVSNMAGAVTSLGATLTVTTNTPPTGNIVLPLLGTLFNAGTTLTFSGNGTDTQDGTLTGSAFTWWIDLQHDLHAHPAMAPTSGVTTGTFVIPNTGHYEDTIWYRIYMVLLDSGGMSVTLTRDINPNKVNLVFLTNPPGLDLTLEAIPFTAPSTVISVVGMIRDFGAPNQGTYTFASWSDGGAQNHSVTVGASSVTYTANFTLSGTSTSTATRTNTAIPPTATSTRTNTPVPPTATSTRTSTPVPPTFTSTRTSTPVPPTSTVTRTNTPVPPTATPTPTRTNTPIAATNTSTPSASSTRTSTPVPATSTSSATATRTSTASLTSTGTPSPTASRTNTPVPATNTSTPSASSTRTHTPVPPTATSSATATRTSTVVPPTSTSSATATRTLTSSLTSTPPVATSTPTATWTASMTPSASPTRTATSVPPTSTPTNTLTTTSSATASSTASTTLTATASPSATPTSSSTDTLTPAPTDTVTLTPTGTLPDTSTPTATATPTASSTPTQTPSLTSTASLTETLTASPSASNTSTPSASPTASTTSTGTPTPPVTMTSTATVLLTSTATPSLTPTLSPTRTPTCACLATSTPTATLLPGTVVIDPPYPNPDPNGMLYLPVTAPVGSRVHVTGYTTTYRVVLEKEFPHPGGSALFGLDLTDIWGSPLPNGLYYLRVTVTDPAGKVTSKLITLFVRR